MGSAAPAPAGGPTSCAMSRQAAAAATAAAAASGAHIQLYPLRLALRSLLLPACAPPLLLLLHLGGVAGPSGPAPPGNCLPKVAQRRRCARSPTKPEGLVRLVQQHCTAFAAHQLLLQICLKHICQVAGERSALSAVRGYASGANLS